MTNATASHEHIAELFTELAHEELAGYTRGDLAGRSLEELAEGFRQAEGVLEGFLTAAEVISLPAFTVLADARRRAVEAHERAEAAIGT